MSPTSQLFSSDVPSNSSNAFGDSTSSRSGLLDLPIEAQTEIVGHASRKTLISLQLVSKHFHGLASARLYARLSFFLTHPESQFHYSSPSCRLSDALHTLATSDRDYARYIKYFGVSLLEQDADDIQKRVVSRFHHQEEATKLLNTMLVLVIRKATVLEKFDWDVPVELSSQVYDCLGKVAPLQDLSIHLDTTAVPKAVYTAFNPNIPGIPSGATQPPLFSASAPYASQYVFPPNTGKVPKQVTSISRGSKRKFSSFQNLRKIQILGIDNLDCLDEISTCLRQSSISLKSLTISLSQQLARKARKSAVGAPNTIVVADPLDDEDDDITQPATPQMTPSPPQPTEADVKRERKIQESVLGRILGLETVQLEDKRIDKLLKSAASTMQPTLNNDEQFLQHLKNAVQMMSKTKASGATALQTQTLFSKLDKAVDKYLQYSVEKKKKPITKPPAVKPLATAKPNSSALTTSDILSNMLSQPQFPSSSNSIMGSGGYSKNWHPALIPTPQDFEDFMSVKYPIPSGYSSYSTKPSSAYPPLPSGPMPGSSTMASGTSMLSEPNSNYLNAAYAYSAQNGINPSALGLPELSKLSQNDLDLVLSTMAAKGSFTQKAEGPGQDQKWASKYLNKPLPKQKLNPGVFIPQNSIGAYGTSGVGQHGTEQKDQIDSESSSSEEEEKGSGNAQDLSSTMPTGIAAAGQEEDDMDVDMEHPDVIEGDSDGDQDMTLETSEPLQVAASPPGIESSWASEPQVIDESSEKGKNRASTNSDPLVEPVTKATLDPKFGSANESVRPSVENLEDTMREYIRMNHGFSLENLVLYLVPLRPSVLAKALDLPCLRSISLLSVGPQGAFWKMVGQYQDESVPINLKSIHTDDVSLAFLTCVSKLSTLENLYMLKRDSKDFNCTTTKSPASMDDIHKLALRTQVSRLQRLAIVSDDDSWDLPCRSIRLITAKGKLMKELAFSVEISDYHIFLQCLAGLRSLVALNLVAIRTTDRTSMLNREARKFLLDVCRYCPKLKLKYIGMSPIVYEIGPQSRAKAQKRASKVPASNMKTEAKSNPTGKGKERLGTVDGKAMTGSNEEVGEENLTEAELDDGEVWFSRHLKYSDVPGISIFGKRIRRARA